MSTEAQQNFATQAQGPTDEDCQKTIEQTNPINVRPETDTWPPPNQPTNEPTEPAPPTKQAPGASS